jgi:hypothetical protein
MVCGLVFVLGENWACCLVFGWGCLLERAFIPWRLTVVKITKQEVAWMVLDHRGLIAWKWQGGSRGSVRVFVLGSWMLNHVGEILFSTLKLKLLGPFNLVDFKKLSSRILLGSFDIFNKLEIGALRNSISGPFGWETLAIRIWGAEEFNICWRN